MLETLASEQHYNTFLNLFIPHGEVTVPDALRVFQTLEGMAVNLFLESGLKSVGGHSLYKLFHLEQSASD